MSEIYYVNGEFLSSKESVVPSEERGHQFGDGVYEVVRVYGGRPFLLNWHLERLDRSCKAIGVENPLSHEEWTELISEAVRRSGEEEAQVYWQVTRGIAPREHLFPQAQPSVTMTVKPLLLKASAKSSEKSLLCIPDERWANTWIKTINLLPNVIAKETAHRFGAVEALFVKSGDFTEGSSSNAWFVRGTDIYTAPANRYILPGITRRFVLQLAQEIGYTVYEQSVALDDLHSMDEVFMTSTTLEVQSIHSVVADRNKMSLLYNLPDIPAQTLLSTPEDPAEIWRSSRNNVAARLQDAFTDAVNKFRNYEEPVQ
ncbi:aminotransferase class IV [Alicyclobacillus sp. SO9]|uniref:aminotransferase class IV n=1 Tax=Alicyclobacillus sp. SO9 TaxID=2665646 RepID=UPI001E6563DC|nr:aminotransferase class IV [Alicyclobacillus sp. SO9]